MVQIWTILFYLGVSLLACCLLSFFYHLKSARANRKDRIKAALINDLKREKQIGKTDLERLKKDRQELFETIRALNSKYQADQKRFKINEQEMFDEIVSLEAQINSFIEKKYQKDEEINQLKTVIRKYERRKSSKRKRNEFDFIAKRFAVLYKNIVMNRKAISGFLS